MIPVVSLLIVLAVSVLIMRIASVVLEHTGLSREIARFQARSAFTGTGFTTVEAENLMDHPVRRRVIMGLMLMGNAGIVTAVSSLMLTFLDRESSALRNIGLLVLGVGLLWLVAVSKWVDRHVSRWVSEAIRRWTKIDTHDYSNLLRLAGGYRVVEMVVREEDWLAGKSLIDSKLRDEGVLVLGITRADGTYLGAPRGWLKILPDDTLVLYGRVSSIEDLDRRRRGQPGDRAHAQAVEEQQDIIQEELIEDAVSTTGMMQRPLPEDLEKGESSSDGSTSD